MQVKKFEAPTIQEALETIKRELGPEAIILQTKKHKRGFGLMSKASVEITAAVSERSLQKKQHVEGKLPEAQRGTLQGLPAQRQAEILSRYGGGGGGGDTAVVAAPRLSQQAEQVRDRVEMASSGAAAAVAAARRLTATRYADIDDGAGPAAGASTLVSPSARPAMAAQPGLPGQVPGQLPAMTLQEEVRHLKRMIEEMKVVQEDSVPGSAARSSGPEATGALGTPALRDAFDQLALHGIEKRFALPLLRRVGFELNEKQLQDPDAVLDQVAVEIMRSVEVGASLELKPKAEGARPTIVALVGPTGVGKTTTVAKLASDAMLRHGCKVGLINLDNYKVAAFDQLSTYAKILNAPFRSAGTAAELAAAIGDFQGLDVILIDTAGRSQRDPESLSGMHSILSSVPELATLMVLAVTTRDSELYDMANRFALFRPRGLILSKLDEANAYGAIYNLFQKTKLPLSHFTTGQRVPEDIEEASPERMAALILDL